MQPGLNEPKITCVLLLPGRPDQITGIHKGEMKYSSKWQPIQLEKGWMWCSWASKILPYCLIMRQEEARWVELNHSSVALRSLMEPFVSCPSLLGLLERIFINCELKFLSNLSCLSLLWIWLSVWISKCDMTVARGLLLLLMRQFFLALIHCFIATSS